MDRQTDRQTEPFVLPEGVPVDLQQVSPELVLQRVDQQHLSGLLVQQLGGPRDRRQDGHEAGQTAVLEVLQVDADPTINLQVFADSGSPGLFHYFYEFVYQIK